MTHQCQEKCLPETLVGGNETQSHLYLLSLTETPLIKDTMKFRLFLPIANRCYIRKTHSVCLKPCRPARSFLPK